MENCLVTQLKATVSSDNLPLLGLVKIEVGNALENGRATLHLWGDYRNKAFTLNNERYFTNNTWDQDRGPVKEGISGSQYLYISEGNPCTLHIPNYKLLGVATDGQNLKFDAGELLKLSDTFTDNIEIGTGSYYNGDITGDISTVTSPILGGHLYILNCAVGGKLNSSILGTVRILSLENSDVELNLADLKDNQYIERLVLNKKSFGNISSLAGVRNLNFVKGSTDPCSEVIGNIPSFVASASVQRGAGYINFNYAKRTFPQITDWGSGSLNESASNNYLVWDSTGSYYWTGSYTPAEQ